MSDFSDLFSLRVGQVFNRDATVHFPVGTIIEQASSYLVRPSWPGYRRQPQHRMIFVKTTLRSGWKRFDLDKVTRRKIKKAVRKSKVDAYNLPTFQRGDVVDTWRILSLPKPSLTAQDLKGRDR